MIAQAPSRMVGADMRGPDQGRPVKPGHGERQTGGAQQRRRQKSVAEIVDQGAPARAEELAGHGQIGREKEHGGKRTTVFSCCP